MNFFAYGTLMWPEVFEVVVGRRLESRPAVLKGFQRRRVKGESYPALIRSNEETITGLVYTDLSEIEIRRLDAFEGEQYDRINIEVAGMTAQVYILSQACLHLAETTLWHPEQLRPEQLAAFCSEDKGWLSL